MTNKEFTKRPHVVYSERFSFPTCDSKKMLDEAIEKVAIRTKLKKIIALLEQMMKEEQQADSKPNRYKRAYRNRTPLRSDNHLSIPVENDCDKVYSGRWRIADAATKITFEQVCAEAEAAYAARNPHKRG